MLNTKVVEGFVLTQEDATIGVPDSLEFTEYRNFFDTLARKSSTIDDKKSALGQVLGEDAISITVNDIRLFARFCNILIESHQISSMHEFVGFFSNGGYPELFRQFHTQGTALKEENVLRKAS